MLIDILVAMLLSISPLGELKSGMTYAHMHEINPLISYFICVAANILVFPVTIVFLEFINKWLLRSNYYKKFAIRFARKTKSRTSHLIEKHGFWGLMVFVMIPLPVTGAYAGSIAAYLFGIQRPKAFMSIAIGVVLSGIIMSGIIFAGFHFIALK